MFFLELLTDRRTTAVPARALLYVSRSKAGAIPLQYVECAPRQMGGHEEDMHLVLPAHSSISLVLRQPAAAVVPRDLNGSPKKLIAIATNSTNSTFMVRYQTRSARPPGA